MRKNLNFVIFGNLLVRHRSHCWKGGLPSRTRLAALQGGVEVHGGGLGEQGCSWGVMLRRIDPFEPVWETGDDRVMLKEAKCVATSSPLDILLEGAPANVKASRHSFLV